MTALATHVTGLRSIPAVLERDRIPGARVPAARVTPALREEH